MILTSIKQAFHDFETRNWTKLYFYFDVHRTIILPEYDTENPDSLNYYPYAKETLQLMTKFCKAEEGLEIIMGLYTCSHKKEVDRYMRLFEKDSIQFKYVNENPEVVNTRLGNFDKKLYFNVLFEDKGGFEAEKEWIEILEFLLERWSTIKPNYGDYLLQLTQEALKQTC